MVSWRGAVGSVAKAAMLACALSLAACGGDKPKDPAAGATQPGAGTASPTAASSGGSQQAGAVQTPTGPLDTSTWTLKPPFYAAGDEPAWRLDIDDGWFSFKRPGLPVIEEQMLQPKQVAGADVFETGALRITIKREACETDGGGKGEFSVLINFDSTPFDGCAFSGTGGSSDSPAAVASAEAGVVVDALKPIDACLAKLGEPALVTATYPREDGDLVGVALRAKNGGVYDCGVKSAGGTVEYLDQMEQGSIPAYMSRFRFLRDGTASAAPCPDAEEVRQADKVVGKLLGKKCKF